PAPARPGAGQCRQERRRGDPAQARGARRQGEGPNHDDGPRRGGEDRDRHRRYRRRPARRARANHRTLYDDPGQGHRARARHRQEDRRGTFRPGRLRGCPGRRHARALPVRCRVAGADRRPGRKSGGRAGSEVVGNQMALDILIVDDEQDIRDLVAGVLQDEGYTTRTAADSTEALHALAERRPSLALLDVWLQGSKLDGLQLLEEIKRRDPTLPVLVISGHGNLDTAVAAIRQGAVDFIEKPFEAGHLVHLVARATETERLRREHEALRMQVGNEMELTGASAAINNVRATLKRVAATGSRVLISGPAGVGKEVAARLLHNWSPRADGPFVVVTAARMTPERVEEVLFGT